MSRPHGDPPLPFALPDITEQEVDAVVEVLRSRWLTTGARTREFERQFAEAVRVPYAVALNSCTAGLHLSLEALGVGPGDLVFLPPYTFAASAEVVRHVGARPVFVDVESATAHLDVAALRHAVQTAVTASAGRPAAVMPVHLAGVPCDLDGVWQVARDFGLAVVEDAAHAFPSVHRGQPVGWQPADVRGAACFSFYATKTLTTGEGGMVTCQDPQLAERIRLMSLHGLSSQAWNRYAGGGWRYDIVAAGYKYNLTDLAAAMGTVQLARAEGMCRRRSEIAARYNRAFGSVPALQVPGVPADRETSWHLYLLRVRSPLDERARDRLADRLRARGVGVSVHFIPLHLHTFWRTELGLHPEDYPVALDCYRRTLSLPIYSAMSDADVERVVGEVLAAAVDL